MEADWSPRTRRRLARTTAALLLAWSLAWTGLVGWELRVRVTGEHWPASPYLWWLGTPPVERFRDFLLLADSWMTEPGPVAFHASGQGFFHAWRWAVFFLPRRELRPATTAADLDGPAYLITWRTVVEHPRLETLLHTDEGVLYRVLPP